MCQASYKSKIALSDQVAIIFDGWSPILTHFVGISATYPSNKAAGYDQALLAFSYVGNELSQDAVEHVDILKIVLQLSGKEKTTFSAIIGDSANLNRTLAR